MDLGDRERTEPFIVRVLRRQRGHAPVVETQRHLARPLREHTVRQLLVQPENSISHMIL